MADKDPYIGETFEDRDSRTEGRRVKVIRHGHKTFGNYYVVEVITSDSNPKTIGRVSAVLASTLDTRYRKVSH